MNQRNNDKFPLPIPLMGITQGKFFDKILHDSEQAIEYPVPSQDIVPIKDCHFQSKSISYSYG